jgi:hypothetical protein
MKSMLGACALALVPAASAAGMANFQAKASYPDVIDAATIRFTKVTHRSATIEWAEPGLGDWKWPILGYEIQISDSLDFKQEATAAIKTSTAATCVAKITANAAACGAITDLSIAGPCEAVSGTGGALCTYTKRVEGETHGGQPVASTEWYKKSATWSTCPAGEDEMSCKGSAGGCKLQGCTSGKLHVRNKANSLTGAIETSHDLVGLKADTIYYVRIRARNHDGPDATKPDLGWSEPSYGLLAHAVPNQPKAPVVKTVTKDSISLLFATPTTRGTDGCSATAIASKIALKSAYFAGQDCTVDGSDPTSGERGGAGPECSTSVSSKPCQTVGSGSAVTNFRIWQAEAPFTTVSYVELRDPVTGLAIFPTKTYTAATAADKLGAPGVDWAITIGNLKPDTEYRFKVSAVNDAGESVVSAPSSETGDALTIKTLGVPLKPLAPTATKVTETSIELTWNTAVGYCGGSDTVPLPSPTSVRLTQPFPATGRRTTECPFDSNVPLTGFRLFASSYNPGGGTVADDGTQHTAGVATCIAKAKNVTTNVALCAAVTALSDSTACDAVKVATVAICTYTPGLTSTGVLGTWEPARRGSLTSDKFNKAYASNTLGTVLPSSLTPAGSWLEINVTAAGISQRAALAAGKFNVDNLAQDTYYKFRILFTNAVGDSAVSDDSKFLLTLEEPVSALKMHSMPPCIYEDATTAPNGGKTKFVATSGGTNVMYKWQLPDGIQKNTHDVRSMGSVIAENQGNPTTGKNCETADCSVMSFTLPSISTSATPNAKYKLGNTSYPAASGKDYTFTLAVVAYNTRGQTMLETPYKVQYCGCTHPWDEKYWDQATYHIPDMCKAVENWDGADKTVIAKEFEYYKTFYSEGTHSAQVILRVDEGSVDMYTSTEGVPDPAMTSTFSSSVQDITSFFVLDIPYAELAGSRELYIAVQGEATFSRFSILATTSEFTRGRGDRYGGRTGAVKPGSTGMRRTQLRNIAPQSFEIKTPYYDFFEYYFSRAENDLDVEIKVNAQLGCVNVYTSKIERYPTSLRQTADYSGYWTEHNGVVCSGATIPAQTISASQAVAGGAKPDSYAVASFDGQGGLSAYGSVTFSQNSTKTGTCSDGTQDVTKAACTAPNTWTEVVKPVIISVSFKGVAGAHDWTIQEGACTSQSTARSATSFRSLSPFTLAGSATADVIYSDTFSTAQASCKSDTKCASITLDGEAISGSAQGLGRSGSASTPDSKTGVITQSVLGRSVVITSKGANPQTACATIHMDKQVTSYIGELSLMHTIKPEETVSTCLTASGTQGPCSNRTSARERLLFVSVQGADPYEVGAEQKNNAYTIEAKVYRYRVESNLLDVKNHAAVAGNFSIGGLASSSSVYSGSDKEDRRYSIVTIDNFNYYEVDLSPAAFGLTVEFTLYYGQVEFYTSKHKLPTQDVAGHDNKFGDVHALPQPGATSCMIGKVAGNCEEFVGGKWQAGALAPGKQLEVGRKYKIHIPFSEINEQHKSIFLGVLGKAPDSSYEIGVTEYVFDSHSDAVNPAHVLTEGEAKTATLTEDEYSFFTLYVGPEDEKMYINQRIHAGHRTGDLGTNPDTWGIDWTEQLTSTWVEQQRDEWDLDVDVKLSLGAIQGPVTVYGSTREPYPSAERGSDASITYGCHSPKTAPTAFTKAACDTVKGTWVGTDTQLKIPHFTFSDKNVYISILPLEASSEGSVTLTPVVSEMHAAKLTGDTATVVSTCQDASKGVTTDCSGKGSCVDSVCHCDNGFLGALCEIEAFCTGTAAACAKQPSLEIPMDLNCDCGTTCAAGGKRNFYCPAGKTGKAVIANFDGSKAVSVPFNLNNIPAESKVHVYVDGLPYPAKGANVLHYSAASAAVTDGTISVFGMKPSIMHTVELLLLSKDNIPLSTDMTDFMVDYAGGCQNNCGDKGVCHHGYCVCYDGFAGVSCGIDESQYPTKALLDAALKAENFKAGGGFVTYSKSLMEHERLENAYVSQLKLGANAESLAASDASIKAKHDKVVADLNTFAIANEAKMKSLADAQKASANALHRKRDRITTTIQQMREESKRLKTHNQEMYLETVRALHEGQKQMQNDLDMKRRSHFVDMAKRHDEWVEIKERNDFKLSQLRTANGPLVNIDDLEERVCTQDDMFRTECHQVDSTKSFSTTPGYNSAGTAKSIGTCTKAEEGSYPTKAGSKRGVSCVCSVQTCPKIETGIDTCCGSNGCRTTNVGTAAEPAYETDVCVKVEINGEMQKNLYDDIPR